MITKQKYGVHKDVLISEFGTGDIGFIGAQHPDYPDTQHLIFYNQKEAGFENWDTAEQTDFKNSDELPVKFVMTFNNPKSITFLIHSLIEIQEKLQK